MCGIAGIIGNITTDTQSRMQHMLQALRHRGPDDSGTFEAKQHEGVLLGFRRLAIQDLTLEGHQPMLDEQRGNVIVFNGEIYNFAELRQILVGLGERFRSRCDTEVLLRAYAHFGVDVLARLRGMFAFAIYDPDKQHVFLARDRLGIKPLYYATARQDGGGHLVFASELRAILASGMIPRRLEPSALSGLLWNGFVPGPRTMIRDVSLLPPGTSMLVHLDSGRVRHERYWSLGPRSQRPAAAAKEELESELLVAAKQHLVSDVPLGIFLSGGVDSSAIASLAVRSGAPVKTFHIGFEEASFDESSYARRVATQLGTEHAEFTLTQKTFVARLGDALASLDQPTFDALNTYFVSRVVREAGFVVALAGTGGDELFGGYESFRAIRRLAQVSPVTRALPAKALDRTARNLLARLYRGRGVVPPQTRWAKLGSLLASHADLVNAYQVLYGLFSPDVIAELARPATLELAPFGLMRESHDALASTIAGLTPLSATSVLELAMFVGERLLRDSDAASMAVSLELRVPLLDHRVVEAAQRVPDSLRFEPLGRKVLLQELAMPQMDRSIFERPKAGFVLPIALWAKDQLAASIEATFEDRQLVESVGLSHEPLLRLWHSFRTGAPGMYWSRVWAPFVLLNWCREHQVEL